MGNGAVNMDESDIDLITAMLDRAERVKQKQRETSKERVLSVSEVARATRKLFDIYYTMPTEGMFTSGKLLQWKHHMRNRRFPAYGQPCVVLEVLESPMPDKEARDSSSPYYLESLDIRVGIMDNVGDLVEYWLNSQRMTAWEEVNSAHQSICPVCECLAKDVGEDDSESDGRGDN